MQDTTYALCLALLCFKAGNQSACVGTVFVGKSQGLWQVHGKRTRREWIRCLWVWESFGFAFIVRKNNQCFQAVDYPGPSPNNGLGRRVICLLCNPRNTREWWTHAGCLMPQPAHWNMSIRGPQAALHQGTSAHNFFRDITYWVFPPIILTVWPTLPSPQKVLSSGWEGIGHRVSELGAIETEIFCWWVSFFLCFNLALSESLNSLSFWEEVGVGEWGLMLSGKGG